MKKRGGYRRALVLLVLLGLPLNSVYAQSDFSISTETSFTVNDVSGPGADKSYLTEGYRYSTGITLSGQNQTESSNFSWRLGIKTTNDRQMEKQAITLSGLEIKLSDQSRAAVIGDTMSSFSDYSMSSSLKGFSYRLQKDPQAPEFTAVYGISYPRWENFWGGNDYKAVKRKVAGLRYKQNAADNLAVGLSYVRVDDSSRSQTWDSLTEGSSITLDWEYTPASDLTIRGESSYSSADTSAMEGSPYISNSGQAHKISISRQADGGQSSLEYERVAADYQPLMGMAVPDRERVAARWSSKLNENTSMYLRMLWYRDYLSAKSTQTARSIFYKPEIGFSFAQPFSRPDASLDLSFRQDRQNGREKQRDHTVSLGYRDKFGATEAEANIDYVQYDTRGGWSDRNTHELTGNTSLSWTVNRGDYRLRPSLNYGYWRSHDYELAQDVTTYEASVGLGLTHTGTGFTSQLKIGTKQKDHSAGDDDTGFANLSMTYKPPFLVKYDGSLNLQAFYNDYRFDRDRNDEYRETGATVTVSLNF